MMKAGIMLIALLLAISTSSHAHAAEKHSESSATMVRRYQTRQEATYDLRVKALESTLARYKSPLVPYAGAYVVYADMYGLDWKLLPAISGIESSFGLHYIPGSYNAYGWGGGYIYFKSWEDGIAVISKALRENYINRGADTVYKIGPIYAPPSKTWSTNVAHFMGEINKEYIRLSSRSLLSFNI